LAFFVSVEQPAGDARKSGGKNDIRSFELLGDALVDVP
jgi:hypothetical protein